MVDNSLLNDDSIIPRLLAHDEQAFKEVVSAYYGIMKHVARSIVGESIADEVVQEAWLAVIKALPKFERRSSFKTWILKIVSNCAKSRLRHESRTISSADPFRDAMLNANSSHFDDSGHWQLPPSAWHADTPEALLSSEQLRSCLNNAISVLPDLQKAVLTLRDIQGLEMETICNILNISESNSRVLLHRAREYIREAVDELQRV